MRNKIKFFWILISAFIFNHVHINLNLITAMATSQSFENISIVIDPGHGGHDPGAVAIRNGRQIYESEIVLEVAFRLRELFNQAGMEHNITMTRESDEFIPLGDRVRISNEANADIFVSIHTNSYISSVPNGIETYFWGNQISLMEGVSLQYELAIMENLNLHRSEMLANIIQTHLVDHLGLNDRGVRRNNFAVINQNNTNINRPWHHEAAAILVELGFQSNGRDLNLLTSENGKNLAAEALFLGVMDYLKVQSDEYPHTFTSHRRMSSMNELNLQPRPRQEERLYHQERRQEERLQHKQRRQERRLQRQQ